MKARQFIKAELKRRSVSYKELADRLRAHGLEEAESGIASKLSRGAFAVTFFLATLAVLELSWRWRGCVWKIYNAICNL
jgi:hypothetical protein